MSRRRPLPLPTVLVGLVFSLGPSSLRAEVFQPGSQPEGRDGGLEVPFGTSVTCKNCHGDYDDTGTFEPYDSWRGTMMANAGRDPIFRAALAIAEEDHPDAADFCIRCHSLGAWLRGRSSLPAWSESDGPRLTPDEDGFLSDDLDGVACVACHRATDNVPSDPNAPYAGNAQIYVLDGAEADIRQGPYEYASGEEPPHPTRLSTFLPRSALCGQCHDIVNPLVDGMNRDGTPTGRPMTLERTFSEWRMSAFPARDETCQTCHMPDEPEDVPAADGRAPRALMRRHELAGGNTWVPRALAATVPNSSGDVTALLEAQAERARAMLTRAASVELTTVSANAGHITASVRVTNQTGHKLPTGYPEGRRMWLEVTVTGPGGEVVTGSGRYDDTEAQLVTDGDDQLRTYEIKLGQGGTESFHFIRNDTIVLDTRIPPEGFEPPGDLDMIPRGRDYTEADGSYRHWDEASYGFDVCALGEYTVRARLRFQTTTREYIEFLRDEAPDSPDPDIDNWGRIAYALWQAHGGGVPTDMAEASAPVSVATAECAPEDAGVGADGSASADAGTGSSSGGGGCGCRIAAKGPRAPATGSAALFAAGLYLRRRRRRAVKRRGAFGGRSGRLLAPRREPTPSPSRPGRARAFA